MLLFGFILATGSLNGARQRFIDNQTIAGPYLFGPISLHGKIDHKGVGVSIERWKEEGEEKGREDIKRPRGSVVRE